MKKSIIASILLGILSTSLVSATAGLNEETTYRSVIKIRNYEYNSTSNTYSLSSIGSAVVVGTGLLLTNAHVIFDADGVGPSGFYEVCRTIDFMKKPTCFTTADLVAYDETEDLALLRFSQPANLPIAPILGEDKINIGEDVIMYGYPAIGGDNITRTEGKIAGYEDSFYKIDGAVDHGNSGGGAFNQRGELVGVPSRVASDNAVIGYMIPITTIRDFLTGKTKSYTKDVIQASKSFRDFVRISELGEKSKDVINDTNIRTVSLKKYGLKLIEKSEGTHSFLYSMNMNNLGESEINYGCFSIGGSWGLEQIDAKLIGDSAKKYKIDTSVIKTKTGHKYKIEAYKSLISKNANDKILITDLGNSCEASISSVDLDKQKKQIDQAITFFTTGITVKKNFPVTIGFDSPTFHIGTIPPGVSIMEFPGYNGEDSLMLGYFSPVTDVNETFDMLTHKKRDTIDSYFLGSSSYLEGTSTDVTKTREYSQESYRKMYEKEYTGNGYSNANFAFSTTKNNKKILLGTVDYRDTQSNTSYTYIIMAYPYMVVHDGKKEYHELSYSNGYKGGNSIAISALKQFFTESELIGDAPF